MTIPGRKHSPNSPPVLLNILQEQIKSQGYTRVYTVHRLDEGTSGVVLFALTPEAHKRICQKFERGEVKKTYLALSDIIKDPPKSWNEGLEWIIQEPLLKTNSKKNKTVVSPEGKESQTIVKILKISGDKALIQAVPLTGRTHQIRVHLAHSGLPVCGDQLYNPLKRIDGRPPSREALPMQIKTKEHMLTACKLEFLWPESAGGNEVLTSVECDLESWAENF